MSNTGPGGLYDHAHAYYLLQRSTPIEPTCRLLQRLHTEAGGAWPCKVLENACGPGALTVALAERGCAVRAYDASRAMCDHVEGLLAGHPRPLDVEVQCAAMPAQPFRDTFDLAICMGSSIHYLLTPQHLRAHLAAVRDALAPGGLYVFEVENFFRGFYLGTPTAGVGIDPPWLHFDLPEASEWTATDGDHEVGLRWVRGRYSIDPVRGILHCVSELRVRRGDEEVVHQHPNTERMLTLPEVEAQVAAVGGLRWVNVLAGVRGDKLTARPDAAHPLVVLQRA